MKYCKNCRVTIENELCLCPLCADELSEIDSNYEKDYPTYPAVTQTKKYTKLLVVLSTVVVAVSVCIDILTSPNIHWSVIVAVGLAYLLLSIRFIRKSRRNLGLLALIQVFGISSLSFFIDFATGYTRWSTNYVIPFVLISATALMTIVVFSRKRRFRDYILYQLGLALLCIGLSLFLLFDEATVEWTGAVGFIYSILTLMGIIIFSSRKMGHELKKRFHF
ncbi:MAG: DUF6320 domain-containing protein [Hydrogenoanaerobacterium sp.]